MKRNKEKTVEAEEFGQERHERIRANRVKRQGNPKRNNWFETEDDDYQV